jgi:hypothetical protein
MQVVNDYRSTTALRLAQRLERAAADAKCGKLSAMRSVTRLSVLTRAQLQTTRDLGARAFLCSSRSSTEQLSNNAAQTAGPPNREHRLIMTRRKRDACRHYFSRRCHRKKAWCIDWIDLYCRWFGSVVGCTRQWVHAKYGKRRP